MNLQLRAWSVACLALAAGLIWGARRLLQDGALAAHELPAMAIVRGEAAALVLLAVAAGLLVRRGVRWIESAAPVARQASRPYATLFVISFVALFVELLLIRYCNSQIRIFAFYKNVPLIGCFLGLGLGCCLSKGRPRHAVSFLLWLVPLVVFLSAGSLVASSALGKHAALGSSEQILGDFVVREVEGGQQLRSLGIVGLFCVATLVVVTLLFAQLGRLLGDAFERVERLPGYTVNIVGSLVGILGFVALSYLETPPAVWFAVGLMPLLWWMPGARAVALAAALMLLSAAAVVPSHGETVWSRYQKLVGHRVPAPGAAAGDSSAYLVEISDVFYQLAVDRRPAALAAMGRDPYPLYDEAYAGIPVPEHVLIVGAGTGNDVAAALRAGAGRVDAVEIDPAIVEMGRRHHPERPYADPRVRVIVDDARHAFRELPEASYDVVVFGLLDSHTQLGMSSVRLDNYVFTMESLAEAKRLVKPGGRMLILAATHRAWFYTRLGAMLESTVDGPVRVMHRGAWWGYAGTVRTATRDREPAPSADLPVDDWPFLYLPARGIPPAYLWVVGALLIASLIVLRAGGLPFARFGAQDGHLFFLGAAFLLMEVHAINRLALLFGTTWLVSAVTIAIVLFLIVCANFTVSRFGRIPYLAAYGALAASLAVSYAVRPSSILGQGTAAFVGFGLVLLSPVFFAGLVFARSFRGTRAAAPAMGANILGSVIGGWTEYATMALGMRALVLFAAAFYALSAAMLLMSRGAGRSTLEAAVAPENRKA